MDLTQILTLIRTHAWIALAWMTFTAVVNTIFRWKSAAELEAFAERAPVVAKLATLIRHLGIDPLAALQIIASFFARNPAPPGGDNPPPTAGAAVSSLASEVPTLREGTRPIPIAAFAAIAAIALSGCSVFTPKNVRTVLDDADKFCILEHEVLDVPAIEVACDIEQAFAPAINAVLAAHREQMARDWAAIASRSSDAGNVR